MTGVIFSVTISSFYGKKRKNMPCKVRCIGRKHKNMSLSLSVSYELL